MNTPKIMVFRPTMEEFKDFSRYIQYMESQGAHFAGVAKVIPPKEWVPCRSYDNIDNFVIPAPIEQVVSGQKGLFTQYNIQRKPVTVKEFRRWTNSPRYEPPFHESYDELERIYWKNITFNSPIYGADISGSLYDKDVNIWNVARLNTLLDVIENDSGVKIEGVNTAYLYFGMWKTTFAWHTEDMDLYSINYVHFGAPKSWYAVPPEHGRRLERLAAGFYPNDKSNCSSFLRHKMTLISPTILRQYGIPVNKVTQEAGEFIITFPYGYHSGFNHGFNCAESTNFASERWVNYGKVADKCTCRNDTVSIDMDIFVQLFQPDQYEKWKFKKHEMKLTYTELPSVPDMNAPFPTWKERIEEFKKLYDISAFLKKLSKANINDKSSSKHKLSTASNVKSPQKQRKKQNVRNDSTATPTKGRKMCCISTEKQPETQESVIPKIEYALDLPTEGSGSIPTLPMYALTNQCLFDRIKTGTRRKSSAKAISSEDEVEGMVKKDLVKTEVPPFLDSDTKKCGKYPKLQCDLKKSACSVQCEPLCDLPLEVISKDPLVMKDPTTPPVKPAIKRRHPISNKSSKKTCSSILFKCGHDRESDCSSSLSATVKSEPSISQQFKQEEKASFREERDYNESVAKLPPYCAICSLFKPYCKTPQTEVQTHLDLPVTEPATSSSKSVRVAGDRTSPLIPEVSFASNVNMPSPLAECQLLDKNGQSPLIQCCVCCVQVHASCYGVVNTPNEKSEKWTCNRCMERQWIAQCSLCCMRGGAMKRISGGPNWAHIVCAIAIPEVYFEDTVQRNYINISKLPSKRLKLKCAYCKKSNENIGVCLQCCSGRCSVSFHTTCAYSAGISIEPGNWPFPVFVHCYKHTMLRINGKKGSQKPVEVGTCVVAKHKNGKYCDAVVKKLKKTDFYKANFKDNSWSDNLYAQDIVSHDWTSGEYPVVGSVVQVKWTDGNIYEAEYRGHSVQETIQVAFEDGLLIDFERNEIFTEDDPLPTKIKRKIQRHLQSRAKSLKST